MEIRCVELQDKAGWYLLDRHLPEAGFDEKVRNKQGYVLLDGDKIAGVLRYNLFGITRLFVPFYILTKKIVGEGLEKILWSIGRVI